MNEESKPLRLVERLSREHPQNIQGCMTNDYLEGWIDEKLIDTGDSVSPLQRLEESGLDQVFRNWCEIVEDRHVKRAEALFVAAKLFDTLEESVADREVHLQQMRVALRAQFEEQFRFLQEKRKLASKVNRTAERFESTISLPDFLLVMWEPLIQTGVFDESGSRLRVVRPSSKAAHVVSLLTNVARSRPPTSGNDLSDYIHDVFTSIDNTQREVITWDQFVSHVIERVYKHSLQGQPESMLRIDSRALSTAANGSVIYKDSFSVAYPQHKQHWVHRISYFAQGGWDSVVALDGKYAVVSLIEDFEKQQGVSDGDEYAQLMGASNSDPNFKRDQMQELLRLSCAAHISNGVHYFKHDGVVNSCEWISKERLFLTVATERKQLRFWNVHNRGEFRFLNHLRLSVPDDSAVTSVRIDEKRLLSDDTIKVMFGTRSGYVLTGDIIDADQIKRSHKFQTSVVRLHHDAVTDMVVLPRSQRVVTCGLDGKIFGFAPGVDCERGATSYVGHKRGVLSMAYSNGYEIFVSGGFEYFALCWAENLPRSPAFKLEDQVQPHQYPICSVLSVPRTPNVYTVDTCGVIKVFDVRTLKAFGSWGAFDIGRVPTHIMHDVLLGEPFSESGASQSPRLISGACYTGSKHRSIILGCRGVHRYVTESRNGDADRSLDLADPIVSVSIGVSSILTAGATVVRVWSISSGRIAVTHRTIRYSPSNVSSAAIDDAGAKIVTGHSDGLINVFQRDSGVMLRRYRFHDGRILYIKLDELHGVIVSSCSRGQLCFWRDRDCASSCRGRYQHSTLLRPVESMFLRHWPPLPDDVSHIVQYENDAISPMALSRWGINRWCDFVQRQKIARQGPGAPEEGLRPVRVPSAFFNLFSPSRNCAISVRTARVAVLSTKTICRVFDYSVIPPRVKHSLFHGRDRPLVGVGLHDTNNLCVVSDAHGLFFVWLLPSEGPGILLSSTFNKCLVSSYSHPHEEFRELEHDGDDTFQPYEKLRTVETVQSSDMPVYQAPEGAIPTITSVHVDATRFMIVTGDDVGFVSLWEIEPIFRGSCDVFDALQESKQSGLHPRWVLAWRAHPVPIIFAQTTSSSNYAVVTAAADNMVSLWTIGGDWLVGLRQGPVVDRTWIFPYPLKNRSALVRYRFEKLFQAFKEGELARLRRVRDGEELDRPAVHPEIASKLFGWATSCNGDAREQIVEVVEPKRAVSRHVGFVQRKRVTMSLRTRSLSRSIIDASLVCPPILNSSQISDQDSESMIIPAFGSVVEEITTADRGMQSNTKSRTVLRGLGMDSRFTASRTPLPHALCGRGGRGIVIDDPRPLVPRASSALSVGNRASCQPLSLRPSTPPAVRGILSLGGASSVSKAVSVELPCAKVVDRPLRPPSVKARPQSTGHCSAIGGVRQTLDPLREPVRIGRPAKLPAFSRGDVSHK